MNSYLPFFAFIDSPTAKFIAFVAVVVVLLFLPNFSLISIRFTRVNVMAPVGLAALFACAVFRPEWWWWMWSGIAFVAGFIGSKIERGEK